jgi:hypothetical protein
MSCWMSLIFVWVSLIFFVGLDIFIDESECRLVVSMFGLKGSVFFLDRSDCNGKGCYIV